MTKGYNPAIIINVVASETLQTTTPKLENDTETKIEDKKNSQISK